MAPGSMVAVLGENFADKDLIVADRFPLPVSLGGVSVKFDDLAARLFAGNAAAHLRAVALAVGQGGA